MAITILVMSCHRQNKIKSVDVELFYRADEGYTVLYVEITVAVETMVDGKKKW